jgi:hypothetical protein
MEREKNPDYNEENKIFKKCLQVPNHSKIQFPEPFIFKILFKDEGKIEYVVYFHGGPLSFH